MARFSQKTFVLKPSKRNQKESSVNSGDSIDNPIELCSQVDPIYEDKKETTTTTNIISLTFGNMGFDTQEPLIQKSQDDVEDVEPYVTEKTEPYIQTPTIYTQHEQIPEDLGSPDMPEVNNQILGQNLLESNQIHELVDELIKQQTGDDSLPENQAYIHIRNIILNVFIHDYDPRSLYQQSMIDTYCNNLKNLVQRKENE